MFVRALLGSEPNALKLTALRAPFVLSRVDRRLSQNSASVLWNAPEPTSPTEVMEVSSALHDRLVVDESAALQPF